MAWLGMELFYEDNEKLKKKQTIEMAKFRRFIKGECIASFEVPAGKLQKSWPIGPGRVSTTVLSESDITPNQRCL